MAISTVDIAGAGAPETTYTSIGDSALTFMSLCNHGGANVTCEIHIVPSGDVAGTDNVLITDLEILAGDTYILYQGGEKILLDTGDFVVVEASLATVAVITSHVGI